MSTWEAPITDRAPADIENNTSKGYLNAADLRRIEGNVAYLSENLNAHGYRVQAQSNTEWGETGVPTTADIRRICANIAEIAARYHKPAGYHELANLAEKNLHFRDVNRLEENLLLFKQLLDRMVAGFRKASFKSGAKNILP